jgi:hypothetical protein
MYWQHRQRSGGSGGNQAEAAGALPWRTAKMTSRTTQKVVRFKSTFRLPGFDAPQPPGDYRVDHDEEPIEVGTHMGWRRVASFIHLPAISASGATQQMVPIDPAFLEAALEQDQR